MIVMLSKRALQAVLAAGIVAPVLVAGQAGEETKLTLGQPSAPPGSPVTIPLTLAASESAKVGSIELRLTFPKAQLTFNKVEPSGLVLGIEGTAEAVVDPRPEGKSSTVRVTVAGGAGAGGRRPLPAGVLAYLGFTIAKTAKPDTTISLAHVATALTTDVDARPVLPFGVVNGKVSVTRPPVPACYFYMH